MKYTKDQRLDIGRRIYEGEISRYDAMVYPTAEYSPIADEFFAVGASHTSFFKVLSRMASIESFVSNFCVPCVQFLLTSAPLFFPIGKALENKEFWQ